MDVVVHGRTRFGRLAVLPLPLALVGVLTFGQLTASSVESDSARLSFGTVSGRAAALPMPPASQMMMPMAESGDHGDELQVVLRIGNDTDAPVTVPFGRVHLVDGQGASVVPSQGLVGDLVLRPHASAEERLHFTDPATPTVRVAVPDGDGEQVITLTVPR